MDKQRLLGRIPETWLDLIDLPEVEEESSSMQIFGRTEAKALSMTLGILDQMALVIYINQRVHWNIDNIGFRSSNV